MKNPTPLPDTIAAAGLLELDEVQLSQLLRDNLLPRNPEERKPWEQLWVELLKDPVLHDRALNCLEDLMNLTEDDLDDGELDAAQTKRATAFLRRCEEAWDRLVVDEQRPLGWAGRLASGFGPLDRRVVEQLVFAIAAHRDVVLGTTEAPRGPALAWDEELWGTLADVGLDPRQFRRARIPDHPVCSPAALRKHAVAAPQHPGWAEVDIHVDPAEPLKWAGAAGVGFKPGARPVLERLVLGLLEHRRASDTAAAVRPGIDEPLWACLVDVGLDPLHLKRIG